MSVNVGMPFDYNENARIAQRAVNASGETQSNKSNKTASWRGEQEGSKTQSKLPEAERQGVTVSQG